MNWGFKIMNMPAFEPTWILFDCSIEKFGNFTLKALGYLQKQCKRAKSCWDFFTRNPEIQNLHWLSGHLSENPLSMCRIPWHSLHYGPLSTENIMEAAWGARARGYFECGSSYLPEAQRSLCLHR
jgi:hypothetical protein